MPNISVSACGYPIGLAETLLPRTWMSPRSVHTRPGSIILLHVMYGNAAESLAAIARIVEDLRAQGYRFVTVSELIGS